jgi:hypothetical protein
MEKPSIPQSLEIKHRELHEQLIKAMNTGGKIGDAAIGGKGRIAYTLKLIEYLENRNCVRNPI